ncbi:bacterioferritin [Geomonas sp. Red32]|uniref:ferritin-like domain-containing protein n=1 Tax=Geomonas sp. Red32 TaxID=2912856 RepID=UPI00202D04A5|nr:ferritin-like domain-containing protein [Geomonas sp. Red32]MCM0081786.1 bacterioferritin [Geomonas sp. Red32]
MKGHPQIIEALNARLIEELTAYNQYSVHQAMAENWELMGLASIIQERKEDEGKHFHLLIQRILLLEGVPVVGRLNLVQIGENVPQMFTLDGESEINARQAYNETIELCRELKDDDTRRLLEGILADETDHLHDIEANQTQIELMTLANYLSTKLV